MGFSILVSRPDGAGAMVTPRKRIRLLGVVLAKSHGAGERKVGTPAAWSLAVVDFLCFKPRMGDLLGLRVRGLPFVQ